LPQSIIPTQIPRKDKKSIDGLTKLNPRGTTQLPTTPLDPLNPRSRTVSVALPGPASDPINDSVFTDDPLSISIDDTVNFKIKDVINNKTIQFRCTVSNLTESGQPSWNQIDYIGRPYPVYVYKGVTRSVTFDFKAYASNEREVPIIWSKINYLAGLIHPAGYTQGGFMIPPYIEFTIGDLFKKQIGFISSYNNSIAPEVPWEVRSDRLKLPQMADINLTINIIENELKSPYGPNHKLYGFDPTYAIPNPGTK